MVVWIYTATHDNLLLEYFFYRLVWFVGARSKSDGSDFANQP